MKMLVLILLVMALTKTANCCCCKRVPIDRPNNITPKPICITGAGKDPVNLTVTFVGYCDPDAKFKEDDVAMPHTIQVTQNDFFRMIELHAKKQGLTWIKTGEVSVLSMTSTSDSQHYHRIEVKNMILSAMDNCQQTATPTIATKYLHIDKTPEFVCGIIFNDTEGVLQIYAKAVWAIEEEEKDKQKKRDTAPITVTFLIGKKCNTSEVAEH